MIYSQNVWANGAEGGTPINAARLTHVEEGIAAASAAADAAAAAAAASATVGYVDSAVVNKATTSYVDSAVAGRASTTYVDSAANAVKARSTHTGTQTASTISDFTTATQSVVASQLVAGDNVTLTPSGSSIVVAATGGGAPVTTTPSATDGDFGVVPLDSFAGASDDAKLTAALSAVAADTFHRTILLTNRQYSFSTVNRVPFDGLKIKGPTGYSNPEKGNNNMPGRVALSGSGAWFAATAEVFGVSLHNLSFTGGSGAWVVGGTANWYCLSMRDIFTSSLKSVVGSQAQKALLTAANFTGDWEINNCYNGAFHMGGSDNTFWSDGMLLDSGTAFYTAGPATDQFHIWMDGMEKSYVGPLYITAEGGWRAIRHDGAAWGSTSSNQGGPITYYGMRVEGRNPGAPCNGSLVKVGGGIARFHGCDFNFAMASPTAANDNGVIAHTGGQLSVRDCTYDRATGVAESVPFVWTNSSGDCQVNGAMRSQRGGTWTGRPRVALASGTTENRITDATVTLITV